jgi:hypothetical protein
MSLTVGDELSAGWPLKHFNTVVSIMTVCRCTTTFSVLRLKSDVGRAIGAFRYLDSVARLGIRAKVNGGA